jgi:diadenosine tetraphosphate (Ap4A) HIT family hydrolase
MACLACDAVAPGGVIVETEHWIVEHTIGSLGVGTLIVKPRRHVLHVADLTPDEASELGPTLQRAAAAVTAVAQPDQVYVCLWSHQDRRPGHIHFVVQPVSREQMERYDLHGPKLQVVLFDEGAPPDPEAAAAFAAACRRALA